MSAISRFLEIKTAKLYYDRALDTLFLEYLDKVKDHTEFLMINTAVLSAFRDLSTRKFVADVRRMGIISVESQRWVVQHLLPGMIDHLNGVPLYHAQILDPSEVFSKVSATNIRLQASGIANDFLVEQFTDRAALEDRLKSLQ